MYRDSGNSGLLVGLLVGVAAGVAVGILLAPRSGSENREMLRDGVTRGVERLRQLCYDRM